MEPGKSKRMGENMLRAEVGKERWTSDLYGCLLENLHIGELDPKLVPDKYQNLVNSWKVNQGPNGD